jgi:hypothetical protein
MYERLRREAETSWTEWVEALADGGNPPEPLKLLEAGGLLGIAQPADALEKDAAALREVRDLEARAASLRERAKADRAPHGSQEHRRHRISVLKAEIRELERLSGMHAWDLQAGQLSGDATRIRRKHPRAFRPAPAATAKKKTSRRKELAR